MISIRSSRPLQALLLIALYSTLALAQNETGALTGHVYCADTQQPARIAHVVLVALPPEGTLSKPKPMHSPTGEYFTPSRPGSDTRLDGSFTIPSLHPGHYYVAVTYSGYLSPEYHFSEQDLLHPTQEIRKHIDEALPTVTIAAGKTSAITIALHRGAAISGVVRYDDGSPVAETEVEPLVRDTDGRWKALTKSQSDNRLFSNVGTDDRGNFRIHELPPGEYSLKLLAYTQGQGTLAIYYGDSFFEKDAKPIKLGEGEESLSNDITIPLSKLHKISGVILNTSGQPINSGKIELLTASERIPVTDAEVSYDEAAFHLDLVPEGSYIARVTQAADIRRPPTPDFADGLIPNTPEYKDKTLRSYPDYEVPIEVLGDIPSLTLAAPLKSAAKTVPPTQ